MQKKNNIEALREAVERCLPDRFSEEGDKLARKLFDDVDNNGNGYASLAEIDKGLRLITRIPEVPGLHTMLLKAYNKAKVVKKSNSNTQNDYVTKDEYIYMLIYLRAYYEFYMQFSIMDTNGDQQLSLSELQKGKSVLQKWKIDTSNLIGVFKQMDKYGGGTVSWREFCQWAIDQYFKIEFGVATNN